MGPKRKKKILSAVDRTSELLARNACPIETLYGVLSRADVYALRTLAEFALKAVTASETHYLGSRRYPIKRILMSA
jgi:hypothetical protein